MLDIVIDGRVPFPHIFLDFCVRTASWEEGGAGADAAAVGAGADAGDSTSADGKAGTTWKDVDWKVYTDEEIQQGSKMVWGESDDPEEVGAPR